MVLYGIQVGYEYNCNYITIFTVSWAIYVYMYGYVTSSLAFYPNYTIASLYHGSMHIFTSIAWTYLIYKKSLESIPTIMDIKNL
jgi:hypothetical protein